MGYIIDHLHKDMSFEPLLLLLNIHLTNYQLVYFSPGVILHINRKLAA